LNDNGTITVPAGIQAFSITVPTVDDSEIEATETYSIKVDDVSATGTILDNDNAPIAIDDPNIVMGSLKGGYWGYTEDGTVNDNLTTISQVEDYIAGNKSELTFTSTEINYEKKQGDLADDDNVNYSNEGPLDNDQIPESLKGFLGDDANSIQGTTSDSATDGIIKLSGNLNVETAGDYKLVVSHDDGFQIKIDGVVISDFDGITHSHETEVNIVLDKGLHTVEIVYWDQGGAYQLEVDLLPINGDNVGDNIWIAENLSHPSSGSMLLMSEDDLSLNIDVLANDNDPDGDPLSITHINGSTASNVAITDVNGVTLGSASIVNVDGAPQVQFVPGESLQSLADGEQVIVTFPYSISDGNGGTATANVTLVINGTNDAPELKPITSENPALSYSTDEDISITINESDLLAKFTDIDGDDLSIESLSVGSGTITDNSDGTWTLRPAPDSDSNIQLTINVTDGLAISSTITTVVVNAVVDAPTVTISISDGVEHASTKTFDYEKIVQELKEGTTGADIIGDDAGTQAIGTDEGEVIDLLGLSDQMVGLLGDDVFISGEGDDSIFGGNPSALEDPLDGFDSVIYTGARGDYTFTRIEDGTNITINVKDNRYDAQKGWAHPDNDGLDTFGNGDNLYSIEQLVFTDGVYIIENGELVKLVPKVVDYQVDINAQLNDTDGSETLSIALKGVPEHATLSINGVEIAENNDGFWDIPVNLDGSIDGIIVTIPSEHNQPFTLSVVATATEQNDNVDGQNVATDIAHSNIDIPLAEELREDNGVQVTIGDEIVGYDLPTEFQSGNDGNITLDNGVVINATGQLDYSNGLGYGVDGNRLNQNESIELTFPNEMQVAHVGVKNAHQDTLIITSKAIEIPGESSLILTGSINIINFNDQQVSLSVFIESDQGVKEYSATFDDSGNWAISEDISMLTNIGDADLVWNIDGAILGNGATHTIELSLDSGFNNVNFTSNAVGEFNGYQIMDLEFAIGTVDNHIYPVDINASLTPVIESDEQVTSVKLGGFPEGAELTIVNIDADGSTTETIISSSLDAHDQVIFSLPLSLLDNEFDSSGLLFSDEVYLTVNETLTDGFLPTIYVTTSDTVNGFEINNETIIGGNDSSTLYGGDGDDYIDAGIGNDILIGGDGNDLLIGGTGADTFVFLDGDTGTDHIEDFALEQGDTLDLSDLLHVSNGDNLETFLDFDGDVNGTTITVHADGGDEITQTIILDGVNLGNDDAVIINDLLTGQGHEGALFIGDNVSVDADTMLITIPDEHA